MEDTDIQKDARYRVALEECGYEARKFVVRFCGDFITACETKKSAIKAAQRHNTDRMAPWRGVK